MRQLKVDISKRYAYKLPVITSYRSKALKLFANKGDASKLPVQNPARLRRMLAALHAAKVPEDMNLPGFRFHGLAGHPKRYAIDVTGNYLLTFAWNKADAVDVDLEDYH